MLLLIIKISLLCILCIVSLKVLNNNSANLKQKLISITFIFSLVLPIANYLPISININHWTQANNSFSSESKPIKNESQLSVPIATKQPQQKNTITNIRNSSFLPNLTTVLIILWVIGMVVKSLRYWLQIKTIHHLISHSKRLKSTRFNKNLKNKPINYIISSNAPVPFLFVKLHSINIVLPKQIEQWTQQNLANVIEHELCHYRRKDHWCLWLADLFEIIYWFNPLVQLLTSQHKELIELACDQQLIEEGIDAKSYAKTLLLIPQNTSHLTIVANMASKPSLLKQRIVKIISNQNNSIKSGKRIFIAFVASLGLLTSCINNTLMISVNELLQFVSHDLSSFRTGILSKNHIQIATFYDGIDNSDTFIEIELQQSGSKQINWIKLGPLKKFNKQIQTWEYKIINNSSVTGRYRITGTHDDGIVDGVAVGIFYSDNNNNLIIHKSSGPVVNGYPNLVCSWPLALKDLEFKKYTPQLTNSKYDSVKRLLCGAQLLKDGLYSIKSL